MQKFTCVQLNLLISPSFILYKIVVLPQYWRLQREECAAFWKMVKTKATDPTIWATVVLSRVKIKDKFNHQKNKRTYKKYFCNQRLSFCHCLWSRLPKCPCLRADFKLSLFQNFKQRRCFQVFLGWSIIYLGQVFCRFDDAQQKTQVRKTLHSFH